MDDSFVRREELRHRKLRGPRPRKLAPGELGRGPLPQLRLDEEGRMHRGPRTNLSHRSQNVQAPRVS